MDREEIIDYLSKTSNLLSKVFISFQSNKIASEYVNDVEFWKWIEINFKNVDLSNSDKITEQFLNKKGFQTQIYGKLYEWDWVNKKRGEFSNFFDRFELPDVHNNPGTDVFKHSIFGEIDEYQLKSYTNDAPNISDTTSKNVNVITNEQFVNDIKNSGYNAEGYMNSESIVNRREELKSEIINGTATPNYEFLDLANQVGLSSLCGVVIGLTSELILSFREWESGKIDTSEYIKRISISSASTGLTSGATTGIMIPVNFLLTTTGATSIIAMPVAFLVHHSLSSTITAIFGKGEYKSILDNANFYNNASYMMKDFGYFASETRKSFNSFLAKSKQNNKNYNRFVNDFKVNLKSLKDTLEKENIDMSEKVNDSVLFNEEDIEYFSHLDDNELSIVVQQMQYVANKVANDYSMISTAPWYRRALMTISGKLKKTEKEIIKNQALMTMYCTQIISEFVKRQMITQYKVNELERKINDLYIDMNQCVQYVGLTLKTTTLLFDIIGGNDNIFTIIKLVDKLKEIDEKYRDVFFNAISKFIPTNKKNSIERFFELKDANIKEKNFYIDFCERNEGLFSEIIKLFIELMNYNCFDENGIQKVIEMVHFDNKEENMIDFIKRILVLESNSNELLLTMN